MADYFYFYSSRFFDYFIQHCFHKIQQQYGKTGVDLQSRTLFSHSCSFSNKRVREDFNGMLFEKNVIMYILCVTCIYSNLSILFKLLERLVAHQLKAHLDSSGLFPRLQYAYRANHSTETAVLKVLSDILLAIDDGDLSALVLLDLSAAFDTVDHYILLRRLDITYRWNRTVLNWFESYLGRRQQVRIGSSFSSLCTYVEWGAAGISSWPDSVPAVHCRTSIAHWEPRSSSASVCWRYTDVWVLCSKWNAVATDPSSIMSLSGCVRMVSSWTQRRPRFSGQPQSSTPSVATVVASCWYRSRCVHRRRPESRYFYWRWRIDVNACNEDGIIMLRYPASTTVYSTFSAANRSSVAGVVTCPQSAGLW